MRRFYTGHARWLLATVVAGLGLLLMAPAPGAQSGAPIVTPSTQVTKDIGPGRIHTLPQLLLHPTDPNVLVVFEAALHQSPACTVHVSRDRGRTWATAPTKPVPPGYASCARPNFGPFIAARFGIDGTLFVASTAAADSSNRGPTDPYVARSTDLGSTWEFSIIKKAEELNFPKPDGTTARDFERYAYVRMAVHPTDPNRVYAGFRRQGAFEPVAQVSERSLVATSTDGGRTFGPPTDIFDQTFKLTEVKGSDAPAMAVDRDGTIYAFTKERPPLSTTPGVTQDPLPTPEGPANLCKPASAHPDAKPWKPAPTTSTMPVAGQAGAGARLLMSRSTDDGKTWSAKAVDTTGIICVPCLTTPEAALDPSTGTIYLAFEQSDSPPPGPRDNRDIYFMRSADGGETWTPKTRLNDDSIPTRNPNYDQMFPGITVAPNGRIDVAWWDFRTNALYNTAGNGNTTRRDQTCFDIFYTSSTDGGQSWAPNSRISDRSMNQNEGYSMHLAYDVRGPVGVASADDMAFIAWQDSRNGRVELPTDDVYLATVVHDDDDGAEPAVKSSSVFLGLAIGLVVAGVAIAVASQMARGRSGA